MKPDDAEARADYDAKVKELSGKKSGRSELAVCGCYVENCSLTGTQAKLMEALPDDDAPPPKSEPTPAAPPPTAAAVSSAPADESKSKVMKDSRCTKLNFFQEANNQKLGLVEALLTVDDWSSSHDLLSRLADIDPASYQPVILTVCE